METKLHQQTQSDTELLSRIGRSITSSLSVEKIIDTVYANVNTLLDATVLSIGIYNDTLNCIEMPGVIEIGKHLPYHICTLDETHKMPVVCFKNKQEILINDMEKESMQYTGSAPVALEGKVSAALIYMPLYIKEEVIGVISVQSFKKNVYTTYHLDILRNLGIYVAIALENARLYESMEDKVRERTAETVRQKEEIEKSYRNIELLSGIGRDITGMLSVEAINQKVYENVNELMDASVFCIGIYSEANNQIEFQGAKEKGETLPFYSHDINDDELLGVYCFKKQKEVFINDYTKEFSQYISTMKPATVGETTESIIYLPLLVKEKPIGVITVQSFKKNAYSDYHLNIMRNLAIYSAIALDNASLYENMENIVKKRTEKTLKQKEEIETAYKNTRLLSEIGKDITSLLSVEKIIETVYENVNELMNASVFGIGILNEEKYRIDFPGLIEKGNKMPEFYYDLDDLDRLAVWCYRNQKEIFINDNYNESSKYISQKQAPRYGEVPESIIYLPLTDKGNTIGVITVQSFKKDSYTEYHLNILRNLAVYVSIAVENARLYEGLEDKVKERTQELEEKNVELKKLSIVASETNNYVIISNENNKIEWVNTGFTKITGYSFKEVIGKTPQEVLRKKGENNAVTRSIDKKAKSKKPFTAEILNYHKNGDPIWLFFNVTPIVENNKIVKFITVGNDITKIKQSEEQIRKQKEEIEKQSIALAKKNKNITGSIQYAKRIQEALILKKEELSKLLPDSFILYKPKDIVSGDFYWFHEQNGKIIIAAVDCTGHGVPGAFMSVIGNSLLNQIVIDNGIEDPAKILQKLHEGVVDAFKKGKSDADIIGGMDLAICRLSNDKNDSKSLEFASARRPLMMIKKGKLELIPGSLLPIGANMQNSNSKKRFGKMAFNTQIFELKKKDSFYLFSDGYCDQFGGLKDKKFMPRRFDKMLMEIYKKPMKEQEQIMDDRIEKWKGDREQLDDILVIGVRV